MTTMFRTANIICQSVNLTDELKINLEYDIHHGLLNIFVKNIGLPCHINVLSNCETSQIYQNLPEQPKICYELTTTYVYDIIDENENIDQIDLSQTMITSSSSSSSCFDEPTMDNDDDGYSTHSLDDIEQQQQQTLSQLPLVIPSSKLIYPFVYSYSEQYITPIRRLIEQLTWLSPFKNIMRNMMMNHLFV